MYDQELLLQEYPPDSIENFQIWATVPVHKMIEAVRMQVFHVEVHLKFVEFW